MVIDDGVNERMADQGSADDAFATNGIGCSPVGTFPNPAALLRLAGHVLIEQHDDWDGADRRYFSEHSMKLLNVEPEEVAIPELAAA